MTKFRERYDERRKRLATRTKGETLTDQSQAADCDINIIVRKHMPGTPVPGSPRQPIYGADLTKIPRDLASAIASVRHMETLRGQLPKEFKDLAIDDLLAYTPDQIHEILQKSQPATEEKKEGDA